MCARECTWVGVLTRRIIYGSNVPEGNGRRRMELNLKGVISGSAGYGSLNMVQIHACTLYVKLYN